MTKRVSIRLPDDLYTQLVERAKADQRTLSNFMILLLNQGMSVAQSVADHTEGKRKEGV